MRDIAFEAAYLRDAVLVGLIHEQRVPEWAMQLLTTGAAPATALAELLSVPVQLSPIRDALRAFGLAPPQERVTGALLTSLAVDPDHGRMDAPHLLRVISDIRRLAGCPQPWAAAITDFEARTQSSAEPGTPPAPSVEELRAWIDAVRPPARFLVPCANGDEAAAFTDTLSRATATATGAGPRGGVFDARPQGASWVVVIDELTWRIARMHQTLPVAATVPYPTDR